MYLKTTLLLAGMTGLLMLLGQLLAGQSGMEIMLIFSIIMNFSTYWFSDKIILSSYGAKEVTQLEEPALVGRVDRLAKSAGLPTPKVCIIDTEMPNAFATGRNPNHAAVAVTTGLLRALNSDELDGVLAHELGHIKNRDILIATIVAALAGVITMVAYVAKWGMIFGGSRRDGEGNGGIGALVMIIVAPIAATLIQLAISRTREFAADEAGARISNKPLALASALSKIDGMARRNVMPEAGTSTAHLFIINPLSGSQEAISNLFRTHPSTEERITRLEKMARGVF